MAKRKRVTLEEAVRISPPNSNKFSLWIVEENVVAAHIPKGCEFGSIGIMWGRYIMGYLVALELVSITDKKRTMLPLSAADDRERFTNLEDLKAAYPELFDVKGILDVS